MVVKMPAPKEEPAKIPDVELLTLDQDHADAILSEHTAGGMADVRSMSISSLKNFVDYHQRLHVPSWRLLEPYLAGDQPA